MNTLLKTLCFNEEVHDLRATEKLLIKYLRDAGVCFDSSATPGVPPSLPDLDEVADWPDHAKRRLGLLVNLVYGLPPLCREKERSDALKRYADELSTRLDDSQAFSHTWYAGDRPADPLLDEVAEKWGLAAGGSSSPPFPGAEDQSCLNERRTQVIQRFSDGQSGINAH